MSRHQGLVIFLAFFSLPCVVFAGWWVKARLDERWSARAWGYDEFD